jgi:hypothetical protein
MRKFRVSGKKWNEFTLREDIIESFRSDNNGASSATMNKK